MSSLTQAVHPASPFQGLASFPWLVRCPAFCAPPAKAFHPLCLWFNRTASLPCSLFFFIVVLVCSCLLYGAICAICKLYRALPTLDVATLVLPNYDSHCLSSVRAEIHGLFASRSSECILRLALSGTMSSAMIIPCS